MGGHNSHVDFRIVLACFQLCEALHGVAGLHHQLAAALGLERIIDDLFESVLGEAIDGDDELFISRLRRTAECGQRDA